MRIERVKNTKRNIIAGAGFKIVAILGPFFIRTVLLYTLGVDYLGLNSLFTSILSFLSLSELGIGSAMVYAMYKPIAEDNHEAICALLNLYKKLYRIIGMVILALGLLLLPFIPHLVDGEVPADISMYGLYVMYLLNTVLSYFLFGYKQSLLLAFQRNDIISTRALIMRLLMYGGQALLLLATKNYYTYVVMLIFYTLGTNLANSLIVDKMFPQYKCIGTVPREEIQAIKTNVQALVGSKICTIMLNFANNLILSFFLGLVMVAKFDNYYYIINAVVGFLAIVYEALLGGLGNSIQLESVEKNHNDFRILTFINFWVVSWCAICCFCLMQPFITLWVGKDLLFSEGIALLFAVYFYVMQCERIVLTYKDAAGIWRQDILRPYVVIVLNMGLGILGIRYFGVASVLIATIISLAISTPWSACTLYKHLFQRSGKQYLLQYGIYTAKAVAAGAVTYWLCSLVSGGVLVQFAVRLVICVVVPNVILLVLNMRNSDKGMAFQKVKKILHRK